MRFITILFEQVYCYVRPYSHNYANTMHRNSFPFISLLFAAAVGLLARAEDGSTNGTDLRALGPFPIGVTTTVLIDSSRTDAFTKEPRTLVTEIWYPATDDARQLPKNKYSDFLPGG